jgi:hypothetical protein
MVTGGEVAGQTPKGLPPNWNWDDGSRVIGTKKAD